MNLHNNYEIKIKYIKVFFTMLLILKNRLEISKYKLHNIRQLLTPGLLIPNCHTTLKSKISYFIIKNSEVRMQIERHCTNQGSLCKGTKKTNTMDFCYIMNDDAKDTKEFFAGFPEISFMIDNERISWTPNQYFVVDLNDPKKYCLGVEHQVYFFYNMRKI